MNMYEKHRSRTQTFVSAIAMLLIPVIAGPAVAADNLNLEGTTITGNQELPKALHIVPWKPAEAGELASRPMNSLIDESPQPIDRDVFLRELEFYEAVHSSR